MRAHSLTGEETMTEETMTHEQFYALLCSMILAHHGCWSLSVDEFIAWLEVHGSTTLWYAALEQGYVCDFGSIFTMQIVLTRVKKPQQ